MKPQLKHQQLTVVDIQRKNQILKIRVIKTEASTSVGTNKLIEITDILKQTIDNITLILDSCLITEETTTDGVVAIVVTVIQYMTSSTE